jgi:hypothetical protein
VDAVVVWLDDARAAALVDELDETLFPWDPSSSLRSQRSFGPW